MKSTLKNYSSAEKIKTDEAASADKSLPGGETLGAEFVSAEAGSTVVQH